MCQLISRVLIRIARSSNLLENKKTTIKGVESKEMQPQKEKCHLNGNEDFLHPVAKSNLMSYNPFSILVILHFFLKLLVLFCSV